MRARLVKVVVQPVVVIDDGDILEEMAGAPIEVPASAWPKFAASAFGEGDMAALLEQYTEARRVAVEAGA